MESCDLAYPPRVLITNRPPVEHLTPLADIAELVFGPSDGPLMPRDEILRLAPTVAAIINQGELRVDAELLDAAPQLRIVANVAVGTDNLNKELMVQRGVWATNTPDAFMDSTADATLALTLALLRRIVPADRYVHSGDWAKDSFRPGIWDGVELRGKVWGIVGCGRIGQAVARRAEAFGCAVIVHRRSMTADARSRDLDALLAESDIVTLHVPLQPDTQGLIDAHRLEKMKPTAILVNVARGPVVVERDLIAALEQGRIAGAALDVFAREPQFDLRLAKLSNVVLTPHLSGGTRESRQRARLQCARNVAAVLRGAAPETPVNQLSYFAH